jgi:hypothetical protein
MLHVLDLLYANLCLGLFYNVNGALRMPGQMHLLGVDVERVGVSESLMGVRISIALVA